MQNTYLAHDVYAHICAHNYARGRCIGSLTFTAKIYYTPNKRFISTVITLLNRVYSDVMTMQADGYTVIWNTRHSRR